MVRIPGLWILLIGLSSLFQVTLQTCDITHIFNCLLPFNGSYPIVKNISPSHLENVCRRHAIPTDDCLTSFRYDCTIDNRGFVDNILHGLSDMCSTATLEEYRTYSLCISTRQAQAGLRQCQITRQGRLDHCGILEEIVRCERDLVQQECGSEVGAWYVLWSLQARTTLDGASRTCKISLNNLPPEDTGVGDIVGPLVIVLIVLGVALLVMAIFICVLCLCTCVRDKDNNQGAGMDVPGTRSPTHRMLHLY